MTASSCTTVIRWTRDIHPAIRRLRIAKITQIVDLICAVWATVRSDIDGNGKSGSGDLPLGQRLRLSLQPTADDASAHLAIGRPVLREGVVQDVVGFDAERVLDDLRGLVTVIAVDSSLKKVRHGYASLVSSPARAARNLRLIIIHCSGNVIGGLTSHGYVRLWHMRTRQTEL